MVKLLILSIFILYALPGKGVSQPKIADSTIIASIDDSGGIRFNELQKHMQDTHYDILYRTNIMQGYRKGLDELIDRRMKVIDFFKLKLDKDKDFIQRIKRSMNEELAIRYYRSQFYNKYVNDSAMHQLYSRMGKEITYRQIVLLKPKSKVKHQIDSLKTVAEKIKSQVENGVSFPLLVRRYSQDPSSAMHDGLMGIIDWKSSIGVIGNQIFDMHVGEVRIMEDGTSIYVVQVVNINKKSIQPFKQVKAEILNNLDERYLDISAIEYDKAKKHLIDETKLHWNNKGLHQIYEWSLIPNFYQTMYRDTLLHAISSGNNLVILKYSKGTVDFKEYLHFIDDILVPKMIASATIDEFKKFILEAVRTNIVVSKATKLHLEREILTPRTTNPVLQHYIVEHYNAQVIDTKIPAPTEQALRQYYKENMDSLYYQVAKVNIFAVIDTNKQTIVDAKQKLQQNVPFNKLAPIVYVKTFIQKKGGPVKSYFSTEPPYLGKIAIQLHLNETAGPLEYTDTANVKQYALIKCIARLDEKQLTYDDVKGRIVADFTKYYRQKIADEIDAQLRKKYSVRVDEGALKKSMRAIGLKLQ